LIDSTGRISTCKFKENADIVQNALPCTFKDLGRRECRVAFLPHCKLGMSHQALGSKSKLWNQSMEWDAIAPDRPSAGSFTFQEISSVFLARLYPGTVRL